MRIEVTPARITLFVGQRLLMHSQIPFKMRFFIACVYRIGTTKFIVANPIASVCDTKLSAKH